MILLVMWCLPNQSNNSANLVRGIQSDDVILYLDARNVASYPGSGTDWYDLSGNEMILEFTGRLIIILDILILTAQMTGQEQLHH